MTEKSDNPEPSQKKQDENHNRLLNEKSRGGIGAERPKRCPAILSEDGKIPTDNVMTKGELRKKVYGTITGKRLIDILKVAAEGYDYDSIEDKETVLVDIKGRIMNIIDDVTKIQNDQFKALLDRRIAELEKERKETCDGVYDLQSLEDIVKKNITYTIHLKNLQFKALLERRIAELDGEHNWKGERLTTEERDFAIKILEELLKEMINEAGRSYGEIQQEKPFF